MTSCFNCLRRLRDYCFLTNPQRSSEADARPTVPASTHPTTLALREIPITQLTTLALRELPPDETRFVEGDGTIYDGHRYTNVIEAEIFSFFGDGDHYRWLCSGIFLAKSRFLDRFRHFLPTIQVLIIAGESRDKEIEFEDAEDDQGRNIDIGTREERNASLVIFVRRIPRLEKRTYSSIDPQSRVAQWLGLQLSALSWYR